MIGDKPGCNPHDSRAQKIKSRVDERRENGEGTGKEYHRELSSKEDCISGKINVYCYSYNAAATLFGEIISIFKFRRIRATPSFSEQRGVLIWYFIYGFWGSFYFHFGPVTILNRRGAFIWMHTRGFFTDSLWNIDVRARLVIFLNEVVR